MYFYAKYYQEITVAEALATQCVSLNTMITDRTGWQLSVELSPWWQKSPDGPSQWAAWFFIRFQKSKFLPSAKHHVAGLCS